ncbi:hypothetical protein CWI36_0082p0030 [Hamiltosporidium magnivora]|uniref:Uncharacterized protein n=1 Tax=Hamiltosporidium magnivora TaxID=148818 RepID=A0A4Q9LL30_9MICR|nr:hypothetical protein CWI36_1412p0020 [Hamiltosporidium magnivora]TBU08934.1 hypothetical protein CWI36_0082p0030 [Hamiltosporidium magnivora]
MSKYNADKEKSLTEIINKESDYDKIELEFKNILNYLFETHFIYIRAICDTQNGFQNKQKYIKMDEINELLFSVADYKLFRFDEIYRLGLNTKYEWNFNMKLKIQPSHNNLASILNVFVYRETVYNEMLLIFSRKASEMNKLELFELLNGIIAQDIKFMSQNYKKQKELFHL